MANTFKRADSGFNPDEGRRPNLADRHGQHSVPYRVQERISCYTGLLDWETLEGCLAAIWPYETRETLQPKMVEDQWVFSAPRKLQDRERKEIARVRDKKLRGSQKQRQRSESPE